MSTVQACGEPAWFMKQENERVFGDLNGVHTITGLGSPPEHPITKTELDGIMLQQGDTILLAGQGELTVGSDYAVGWSHPDQYDISLQADAGHIISFKQMDERIRRLEEQVELWKSAAMTLKKINDEIRPRGSRIQSFDEVLDDPITAYERAKKATK